MAMRGCIPMLALGLLQACVVVVPPEEATPWRWSRPATSYNEFFDTRFYCLGGRSRYDRYLRSDVFFNCMTARAYRIDPFGPFVAPLGEPL